ncbi:MAG: zinc metalloprotease HtpX, partial [Planctomycetota bacterium]
GPQQAPALFQAFHQLAKKANLKNMPSLYYVPTRMPNAFATGHGKNAAVAVTDGLLRMMSPREMEGILAHELAHLMHRDTKVMALADTISRITSTASRIGFFLILVSGFAALFSNTFNFYYIAAFGILFVSPTLMILMQLALSRSREFNADLGAIQLTGDALGLASALNKLERLSQRGSFWQRIFSPGQKRAQPALLRTHPPTQERIKRLLEHEPESQTPKQSNLSHNLRPTPIPIQQPRKLVIQMPRVRTRPKYRISSGMWH